MERPMESYQDDKNGKHGQETEKEREEGHGLRGQNVISSQAQTKTIHYSGSLAERQLMDSRPTSRAKVRFILNPEPMTAHDMASTNTGGMVKREAAGKIFYTFPDTQDIYVSTAIHGGNYWEKEFSDSFCEQFNGLAGKADFLDVGANIGSWSIPLASCLQKLGKGGSVIAVEAMPDIAKHLAASINANELDNIALYNYAVGEGGDEDSVAMHLDTVNKGGSNVTADSSGDNLVDVRATTLESILQHASPKLFAMKMDIEGFEGHALLGAGGLLDGASRPCLLQLELKDCCELHGKTVRDFVKDLLDTKGYVLQSARGEDHVFHRFDFEACSREFSVLPTPPLGEFSTASMESAGF